MQCSLFPFESFKCEQNSSYIVRVCLCACVFVWNLYHYCVERLYPDLRSIPNLTETTRLTFPFQKTQDVTLTDGTLDVTDDGTSGRSTTISIHKFDTDLGDVTGVTGTSQDTVHLCKFHWLILLIVLLLFLLLCCLMAG